MNRFSVGSILIAIGLLLIVLRDMVRFVAASAFTFKTPGWSNSMVQYMLDFTPQPYSLTIPFIFIFFGIAYLVWSIVAKEK